MWLLAAVALAADLHDEGVALRTAGDLDQATHVLLQAVDEQPADGDAWFDLAVTQGWNGQLDDALQSIEYAIEHAENPRGAEQFRARLLSWDGQARAASDAWRAIAARYPDDANAQSGAGDHARSCGSLRRARQHYTRALTLDPSHQEAADGLADVQTRTPVRFRIWGGLQDTAGSYGGFIVEGRPACHLRGSMSVQLPPVTDTTAAWAKGVRWITSLDSTRPGTANVGATVSLSAGAARVLGRVGYGMGSIRPTLHAGFDVSAAGPMALVGPSLDLQLGGPAWGRLSALSSWDGDGIHDVVTVASVGHSERARADLGLRWDGERTWTTVSASAMSPSTPAGQGTFSVSVLMLDAPIASYQIGWVIGRLP